ncbi:MAG: 16S rRNA (guanine(527)-N(7))-methyltransferase RsmG [Victivallaceae bacterium]|nr:16S rRNA (guanine(527)-N(7))-methyltransferase RsmG [Victivallaceae bacterium]
MNFDLTQWAAGCGVKEAAAFAGRCEKLRALLVEANTHVNLTRIVGEEEFAVKHIADSLAIARYFPEIASSPLHLIDIGCGAGFPSLALALAFPQLRVTAIDSTGKKVAFVERAASELGIANLKAVHGRSNELAHQRGFRGRFDVLTARAVAPAPVIWGDAEGLSAHGGRFILYKTPVQADEDLPALAKLCGRSGVEWRKTETFELPGDAGCRLFIYSISKQEEKR